MGQIKNIKLHIVTDIKITKKWVNIQQSQKIQQNRAKHVARISEYISRIHVKQLKPSRRCTSEKRTDISKMSWRRSKSSPSDDSTEVWDAKLKQRPTGAPRDDGL